MLRPFSRFCVRIGAIPESIIKSMSYEEQLIRLIKFLKETIIPAIDENADAIEELQSQMVTLQNYVNHYFDNLDVQDEINIKLDKMVEDGTLTNLIKRYIDPQIESLHQEIQSVANGSPLVANSISDMTDTTRTYVLTSNGYWYYYNGNEWVQGGVYQSTQIADESISPSNTTFYDLISLIPYTGWITGSVYYETDGHLAPYTQTSAYNPKEVNIEGGKKLIYHNEKGITGLRVHFFNTDGYISTNQIINDSTSVISVPVGATYMKFSSYSVALTTLSKNIYLVEYDKFLNLTNEKNAVIKYEYFNDINTDDILIKKDVVKIINKTYDKSAYQSYTNTINNNKIEVNATLTDNRTSTKYPGFYFTFKDVNVGDEIIIKSNIHKPINMFQGKLNTYNVSNVVANYNMTDTEEYKFTFTQNMKNWLDADSNNCFVFTHNVTVQETIDTYYIEFATKYGRVLTDFINQYTENKEYKALFLGDSITAATGSEAWYTYFNQMLNITEYENVAVPGAVLHDLTNTPYDGNPTYETNNVLGNQVQKVINNYNTYLTPDFIIIAVGTNSGITTNMDSALNEYFNLDGTTKSLSNVNRKTDAGAFRWCNEKLHELYPDAMIVWCTPIQANNISRSVNNIINWGNNLKLLCSIGSNYCIDSEKCGIMATKEIRNQNGEYLKDGLHPNSAGAKKLGSFNACEFKKFLDRIDYYK